MKNRITAVVGLLALLFALAVPVSARQATPDPDEARPVDPRFGLVESFWGPEEATELNVGWDRILFYWNEIQPTGPDDWNTLHVLEEWLDDARAHDRVVMGLLKNTPQWATDGPPFSGVPRGLYLPIDDPNNLWAAYIGKVVDYYAPLGVHHWIVWNEPEIASGVYGHEFDGSLADYYQLLKVTYQVARERDPEAVIHLAGYSYWHDPAYMGALLQLIASDPEAAANDYYFDVVSLHIYFNVETVETLTRQTFDLLKANGIDKPVWINETNASPNLDPLWPVERPQFQIDLEQQAWYIVQAYALGYGAGAESIGVYKLIDVLLPEGGESFGIVRPDFSRRPAFDAYRTIVERLSGFVPPVGRQQTDDYYLFSFERPEDVTRVLWARIPATMWVRVPALADEALLVSATGETLRAVRAVDGFYAIRLEGARCNDACSVGGPPLFLIEQRDRFVAAATPEGATNDTSGSSPTPIPAKVFNATLTPVPTVTPTPLVSPTPEPTATLPPTATPQPTATATPSPTPEPSPTPLVLPTETPPAAGDTGLAGRANAAVASYGSWIVLGIGVALGSVLAFNAFRSRR
jgi:hypothetical protein